MKIENLFSAKDLECAGDGCLIKLNANQIRMKVADSSFESIFATKKGGIFYVQNLKELWITNCNFKYFDGP